MEMMQLGALASNSFHLHGYQFAVLEVNGPVSHPNTGTHRPVMKDTILVPAGGSVTLRIRTDNPGYWLAESQIESFASAGMRMIFRMGRKNQMPARPNNFPTCGDYL